MNPSSTFNQRLIRARKLLRRVGVWLVHYFSLTRSLNGQLTQNGSAAPSGWRKSADPHGLSGSAGRRGPAHFYLGVLAGCFVAYFVAGGPLLASGPLSVGETHSLAGILAALLFYPAIHRLGHFEDLRTVTGSLLVSGMFGFIIPLLLRILTQ